jgi:succinyl-diaminopimelate desuccinylase
MTRSAVDLTRELVRLDTINPPGNELACAQHLGALLEGAGFDVTYHDFGEKRANLIARLGGSAEKPALCFTGHIDTVPLGLQPWRADPFAAEIADGKLYGRGSSDMKSGVAAFTAAAVGLADRLAGTPGLELVITAGEETGCNGAYDLAKKPGALGKAGAIVVGEPSGNHPWVGHKGALWLNGVTTGVTAHGSMPDKGVNAVYKAARAVSKLEKFDFNVARHAVLGPPTLNVGRISGGLNINSVPDRTEIGIDIRTIPEQDNARIKAQLATYLGEVVALETLVDVGSIWTDPEDTWIRKVFEIVREITGAAPEVGGAPYFTDASALTPAYGNPPTVVLGPGEAAMAHQTDEYCVVDRIDEAVDIYTEIARRWCGV